MNSLESTTVVSPFNIEDECAKFTIDDTSDVFKLPGTMLVDNEYTFSCWLLSDSAGTIAIADATFDTNSEWSRFVTTFTTDSTDLLISFLAAGVYYMYHPQLELGNKATDWTPNPEDVDASIDGVSDQASAAQTSANDANTRAASVEASLQVLADKVVTLVEDDEGNTTGAIQTSTGWTFSLSDLENTVNSATEAIDDIKDQIDMTIRRDIDALTEKHNQLADRVVITSYNDKPCILLAEDGGHFKLYITNTEMFFTYDDILLTTITNKAMRADNLSVSRDLQIGGSAYTNLVPESVDDTLNAKFNDVGYMDDYALDTNGDIVESSGNAVTGFIPVDTSLGNLLYTRNFNWDTVNQSGCYFCLYDASLALVLCVTKNTFKKYYGQRYLSDNGDFNDFPLGPGMFGSQNGSRVAYIRFSGAKSGSNFIVAFNQRPQGTWTWKQRSNGNLGCIWDWKGGNS